MLILAILNKEGKSNYLFIRRESQLLKRDYKEMMNMVLEFKRSQR